VTNVALNVRESFKEGGDRSLSPHLYWVDEGRITELEFTLDDEGQIDDLDLPDELVARWEDS
jgi:hypothetical protein